MILDAFTIYYTKIDCKMEKFSLNNLINQCLSIM